MTPVAYILRDGTEFEMNEDQICAIFKDNDYSETEPKSLYKTYHMSNGVNLSCKKKV